MYPAEDKEESQIFALHEMTPKTLALAKEAHMQENSISLMPRTGKAGIFEIERTDNYQTQYRSLYELPNR